MIHLTFRTKLLASHVAVVAAVVLIALFDLDRSLGADLAADLDRRLELQAVGAAQWINAGRHPDKLAGRLAAVVGAGVTILDRDGAAVGEADPGEASFQGKSSLGDAPEIVAARASGIGRATRRSPDGSRAMRYVAVPAGEGLVLRLAMPLSGIEETVSHMRRRLLFAAGLAVAAAIGLGIIASRVAARPLRVMTAAATRIAQGDYAAFVASDSPDDFGVLARALGSLAAALQRDMTQIRRLETTRKDFVANASHELRTPVTAIQGYAETLLDSGADAEKSRRFVEVIHRHARRLGVLLERLLLLSELEARPPEDTRREAVPLGATAAHVVETLRERAAAAGATVRVDINPAAIALGDPDGVEQVVENLVDNALKYGKAGGVVRIEGARAGDRVRLAVIDDGPGVASPHLPRLFERFYRVDPGRSRERGGTGLGLAIVKHLVEAMSGSVTVASAAGEGCRFTIDLPAAPLQTPDLVSR
jgi:signal transduction histidine kinase